LGRYDEKIQDLFADIKGTGEYPNGDVLPGSDIFGNDSAEYLIRRRLEAWTYLFEQDALDSGIMLTGSRFLLEHILENVPSAEKIHSYKCTPCLGMDDKRFHHWQDNLMAKLASLVKAGLPESEDWPLNEVAAENGDPHVSLNLFILPELSPLDCLAACVSKTFLRSDKQIQASGIRNTVIGLVKLHQNSAT
jgi:hypothetical protein